MASEAPGERLTPQQMRERLTQESWARDCPPEALVFLRDALAAWQADREALEAAQQEASLRFGLSQDAEGAASGFRIERDRAVALLQKMRPALEGFINRHRSAQRGQYAMCHCVECKRAIAVLAELDAAQGETPK